jgi:hypothetical protein
MIGFTNIGCANNHPQIAEVVEALAVASACLSTSAFDTNAATTKQSALSAQFAVKRCFKNSTSEIAI